VEERIALGVQRGAEVCGVQLDLPWSGADASASASMSFSILPTRVRPPLRAAMDDAVASRVVDQWSGRSRLCTVISARTPREA
jgi:hypothetical protein